MRELIDRVFDEICGGGSKRWGIFAITARITTR